MNNKSVLKVWRAENTAKRQRCLKVRRFFMGQPYKANKFGDVWYLPRGGK